MHIKEVVNLVCKRHPGSIVTKNGYILDQLSDIDNEWRFHGSSSFNLMIRDKYNLTPMEYHNIVVHGDINYHPVCPVCGSDVEFRSLTKGYRRYCSRKCYWDSKDRQSKKNLGYNHDVSVTYVAESIGDDDHSKFGISSTIPQYIQMMSIT